MPGKQQAMEHKMCEGAEVKILGKDDPGGAANGLIKGHAAHFNSWDRTKELIVPGAFKAHLATFLHDGFVAGGHDWKSLPIASPVELYEDATGLFGVAEFHSTSAAQDARAVAAERLARGKSVALSIGYEVKADEFVPEGRKLLDLPLFEWSLVNVPANPLALVTGVKSLPLDDHAQTVQAAVSEYLTRVTDLAGLRAKDGRVLSGANRTRLAALQTALQELQRGLADLLAAAEPKAAPDAKHELARFLAWEAARNGVTL